MATLAVSSRSVRDPEQQLGAAAVESGTRNTAAVPVSQVSLDDAAAAPLSPVPGMPDGISNSPIAARRLIIPGIGGRPAPLGILAVHAAWPAGLPRSAPSQTCMPASLPSSRHRVGHPGSDRPPLRSDQARRREMRDRVRGPGCPAPAQASAARGDHRNRDHPGRPPTGQLASNRKAESGRPDEQGRAFRLHLRRLSPDR
jgi:hypothetical protein